MERIWLEKFGILHHFEPDAGTMFKIEVFTDACGEAELCILGANGWATLFDTEAESDEIAINNCKEYMDFLFPPLEDHEKCSDCSCEEL